MKRYYIEIPHRDPPKAYATEDKHFIEWAYEQDGFLYWTADMKEMLDCCGERDEIEAEALEILDKHGTVTEIATGGQVAYYAPDEVPTELEAAQEYAGHDLHAFYVFDTADELREWARTYHGAHHHQWPAVQAAVEVLLEGEEEEGE